MKKKISAIICMILAFTMLTAMPVSAKTLGDGVWNVKRTVSYVDPVTGKNPTGSGDSQFGQNIANNVLEATMLIENNGGKTYYTIGMGFMSYAGNGQKVDVKVQQNPNDPYESYKSVNTTKVGSCDGGECHHLKFEVPYEGARICVSYYVDQMNRQVYFFVDPNLSSAKQGNGAFGTRKDGDSMRKEFEAKIGEKVDTPDANYNKNAGKKPAKDSSIKKVGGSNNAANNGQAVNPNEVKTTVAEQTTVTVENAETTTAAAQTSAPAETKEKNNNWIWIVVAIVAAAVIVAVVIIVVKKKKAN